jgi:hypothetical protein
MKPVYTFLVALAFVAAPLLSFDFNTPATQWPELFADTSGPTVFAEADWGPAPASPGLVVTMDSSAGNATWETFAMSGPLAVKNTEATLARLSLAFSLSASAAHPVIVRIESLDASRNRTGALERRVQPAAAAPADLQRHTLALDTFKPHGPGTFDPTAPFIQLVFAIDQAWPAAAGHVLRIDDVVYGLSAK